MPQSSAIAGACAALDLRLLARLGESRDNYLKAADESGDAAADEVLRARSCGGRPNMTLAAKLAGVSKDTLYARVKRRAGAELEEAAR